MLARVVVAVQRCGIAQNSALCLVIRTPLLTDYGSR
jgi:hypothetical protein